jgi:hypothetical protein
MSGYARLPRTVRVSLEAHGEPDLWFEIEHPEAMTWKARRRFAAVAQADQSDPGAVALAFAGLVLRWNLPDLITGEVLALPPTADVLDALPAHVIEGMMIEVAKLGTVPKANESGSITG